MSKSSDAVKLEPKPKILELLAENRIMTVATLRPDGWPQATIVGYVHDDLTLYFAVARISQKMANIVHDLRISIALGHDTPNRLRGLSMAAHATQVTDPAEIEHLNELISCRYPEAGVFSPREVASAVLRAVPVIVSLIDLEKGPGEPELLEIGSKTTVHHIRNMALDRRSGADNAASGAPNGETVLVRYTHASSDKYRPGAPL